MSSEHDIVIVGGGMVGASLACALASSNFRVALLEARPFGQSDQPSYDSRTVALAYGSKKFFDALGLWQRISTFASPIEHIHVSECGRFGVTRFHREEEGVEALGYVVANHAVGQCLYTRLDSQNNVTVFAPARLQRFAVKQRGVTVYLENGSQTGKQAVLELHCRLLVAADGNTSIVRRQAGIGVYRLDYGQSAIIANVRPERHHRHIAFERFTETGPLAMLPMREGWCSMIWTNWGQNANSLITMDNAAFLTRLQQRFGYRLGRFVELGVRQAYPLSLVRAQEIVRPRIALLGNAAHSLHPVAGQGFNLALRDVATLAELLYENSYGERDAGSETMLTQYARWRRDDFNNTVWFTDGLARLFINPLFGLRHVRGLGLVMLDIVPPLRRRFVRRGMGFIGRVPRLVAGQPLEDFH